MDYQEFRSEFVLEEDTKNYIITDESCWASNTIEIGWFRGKRVAIKMGIDLDLEAEIYKKIGYHQNIVQLISEIKEQDNIYLLLEGIKNGTSISDFLDKIKFALPIPYTVNLIKQMALGLLHLHSLNIVHRDFRSKTILIDLDNNILKITDFGISEIVDDAGCGTKITQPYIAPECEVPVTKKVDIFGFGSICVDILSAKRTTDQYRYTLPIPLLDLVERCQNPIPEERPDINDIVLRLDEIHKSVKSKSFETHKDLIVNLYQKCINDKIQIGENLE
jgi:serine/threonine protein kinase